MSVMHQIGRQLRKEEASTYNRLLSILHDADYVESFKQLNPKVSIVANLRCGQWYSSHFDTTCYFKSSDGHCPHWKFNLRRFNPHIAIKASQEGVVALVDSTRKGKRFPDSFTRTIPIWVAVVNRAVYCHRMKRNGLPIPSFEEIPSEWKEVELPHWITETERHQVTVKVKEFCEMLMTSEAIRSTLDDLATEVKKPLKCHWICPDTHPSRSLHLNLSTDSYSWIVLLCPSGEQNEMQSTHVWYIQGAADDEETWALGLTAPLFWAHQSEIMAREESTADVIALLLAEKTKQKEEQILGSLDSTSFDEISKDLIWIVPGQLAIADTAKTSAPIVFEQFDLVINCSSKEFASFNSQLPNGKKYMHIIDPFEKGNNAKFKLSRRLPATIEFSNRYFLDRSSDANSSNSPESTITTCHPMLIHGFESLEIAIGLAIGVLSIFYSEDLSAPLSEPRTRKSLSKAIIKQFMLHVAKLTPQQLPSNMMSDLNRYFLTVPPPPILEQQKTLLTYVP